MFVKVRYYKSDGRYGGPEYCYETSLNLDVGDCVIAPTRNEARQRAIVTAVKVHAPSFPCREIKEYDPDGRVV